MNYCLDRKCIRCSKPITTSMGFTLARDMSSKYVSEICGKCGLLLLDLDKYELRKVVNELVRKYIRMSSKPITTRIIQVIIRGGTPVVVIRGGGTY